MSISWGTISGHERVGIDYSVTHSGSRSIINWTVYVQSVGWGFSDPQTINISGAVSASRGFTLSSPNGGTSTLRVWTGSSTTDDTAAAHSVSLTAKISGAYTGATPSKTLSVSIAGVAPYPPDAPDSVTAVRINDNESEVSWIFPWNSNDNLHEWKDSEVQREDGDNVFKPISNAWETFYDTTILPNSRYSYRVRGKNDTGVGDWSLSNYLYTTPAEPGLVKVKALNSTTATLTWPSNSPWATSWIITDNGKPINQSTSNPVGFTFNTPTTALTDHNWYNAFPYGDNTNDGSVSVFAWRVAHAHVDARDAEVAFTMTTTNGQTTTNMGNGLWNGMDPASKTSPPANTYCSPAGISWDETNRRWVLQVAWQSYTDDTHKTIAKRWSQIAVWNEKVMGESGGAKSGWQNVATVDITGTGWFFPSSFRVANNGKRWIACGYGGHPDAPSGTWQALFVYSDDQGKSWKTAPVIKGLPSAIQHWAEPQFKQLQDGSWYALLRAGQYGGQTADTEAHYAISSDGINWTYGGLAFSDSGAQPSFTQLPNGMLMAVSRRKRMVDASGNEVDAMGQMTWAYSFDNGRSWTYRYDSYDTKDSFVYAAVTWGTDGLPITTYAVEDDPTRKKNPMTATVYMGTAKSTQTAIVIPDPKGTGYTISGLDPKVKHQFGVQAVAGGLVSGVSETLAPRYLQAPPDAPDNLVPSQTFPQEVGKITRLSWDHNPEDTTAQTAFTLRYRPVGSSTWTTVPKTAQVDSHYDIPGGPQALNTKWEWQVQTWGTDPSPSPWSSIATYGVYDNPTLTLNSPVNGDDNYKSSDGRVDASWTFNPAGTTPEAMVFVLLEDLADNSVVDTFSQAGNFTSWISDKLIDGHQYQIWVTAMDANYMVTPTQTAIFTVQFEKPPTPWINAEWNAGGYVKVDYGIILPQTGPPVTSITLMRSINGGGWETVLTHSVAPYDGTNADDSLTYEFMDVTAPMAGYIRYRVVATSDLPSSSDAYDLVSLPEHDGGIGCGVWLSGGPKFMQLCYLKIVTKRDLTSGRDRVLNNFAGRTYGVETSKSTITRTLAVTATLEPMPDCQGPNDPVYVTGSQLEALFDLPGPHLYRDATGRTMYCYLSSVTIGQNFLGQVSFTVTQADRGSDAQLLSLEPYSPARVIEVSPGQFGILGGDLTKVPPGQWTWDDGSTN